MMRLIKRGLDWLGEFVRWSLMFFCLFVICLAFVIVAIAFLPWTVGYHLEHFGGRADEN